MPVFSAAYFKIQNKVSLLFLSWNNFEYNKI